MRRLRFAIWITYGIFSTTIANAKPEYLGPLFDVYKGSVASLEARSCTNCHVSETDFGLNPYGMQVALERISSRQEELTEASLRKIEPLDADGDGVSNLNEINAGTAPGDPMSGGTGATRFRRPPLEVTREPER